MSLVDDLRGLTGGSRQPGGTAKDLPAQTPIPATRGVAMNRKASGGGGGGSFVEQDYAQREYWPAITLTSSDGLLTFEVEPIKSILLDDGTRATFKEPV